MSDPIEKILCEYLGTEPDYAPSVANRLAKYAFWDDPYLYDEIHDIETLERLERAVIELDNALDVFSMTQSAQDLLAMNILRGPHQQRLEKGLQTSDKEMDEYITNVGKPATDAIMKLPESIPTILAGITTTKTKIRRSDRKRKALRRINIRGIQLVSAARDIWEEQKGESAPQKALNPASTFGKYLSELFDAFQVEGDPKAAFRAWARQRENVL